MTKSFIVKYIRNKMEMGEVNYFRIPETGCRAMVIDTPLYVRVFVRSDDLDDYDDFSSVESAATFIYTKYVDIALTKELNK